MNELQLTPRQRRRLQRQFQQTDDARVCRRTLAILEYSQGRPIAEIARMMGVTRQSVYHWVDAYAQDHDPSALYDGERSGRPTRWTEQLQAQLQALMGQTPDQLGYFALNWTAPLLREHLERRPRQGLSEDTIRRELDRLGYVWKRSRYVLDPDPQREKKTLDLPVDPVLAGSERPAGGG
jgi:transposase